MLNFKSLLKKHLISIEENNFNIDNIILILKRITNLSFNRDDLEIKNGSLFVKTTPVKRNILFLNKEKLLKELKFYKIKDIK